MAMVSYFPTGTCFECSPLAGLGFLLAAGQYFLLDTATMNVLTYYHGVSAIKRWNALIQA
ncbi:MAG TPA: hypothetical protein VH681_04360 [Nitrospiraceae bacterium]|jgi:hypothetical protein